MIGSAILPGPSEDPNQIQTSAEVTTDSYTLGSHCRETTLGKLEEQNEGNDAFTGIERKFRRFLAHQLGITRQTRTLRSTHTVS